MTIAVIMLHAHIHTDRLSSVVNQYKRFCLLQLAFA